MKALRNLKVLYAIAAVLFISLVIGAAVFAHNAEPAFKAAASEEPAQSNVDASDSTAAPETAETPAAVESAPTPTTAPAPVKSSVVAPQEVTGAVAPEKTEAGGHVPFTNQPVTPGDPDSYIGTVGQCPFYEMAGEKGCIPPPYVECNADWSVCTYKGE